MLCKTKKPPITTYKDFFRACRALRKYGFKFQFVSTVAKVRDDYGTAEANAIWYRSPSTSYWNPIEVIHYVFYATSTGVWTPATMARPEIGLPHDKFEELVAAYRESRGHLLSLRARMCKALDLEEIPIDQRPSYKRRKRKRRRRT